MVSPLNSASKSISQALNPAVNTHKIRLAEPADLPDIVTIYNQSIAGKASTADLTPVTVADRQAWFDEHLSQPNRPIYVVTNTEGVIMAWGSFSDVKNRIAYHISSGIRF